MKKIFYLVIFAIFIIFPKHIFAQKIGLGIKGGLNLATTTLDVGKAGGDKEIFVGLNAGAYAYIKLNKLFALQTEINYLQQGYKRTDIMSLVGDNGKIIENINIFLKTNYNYLQIPILLRTNFNLKKFKFWGNTGIYASYLLSSQWSINPDKEDPPYLVKQENDNASYVNNIDFGLCLGAGIGYKLGIGYATFDARYNYGLSEIGNEKAQSLRGYLKQEHRNLVCSVGYLVEF